MLCRTMPGKLRLHSRQMTIMRGCPPDNKEAELSSGSCNIVARMRHPIIFRLSALNQVASPHRLAVPGFRDASRSFRASLTLPGKVWHESYSLQGGNPNSDRPKDHDWSQNVPSQLFYRLKGRCLDHTGAKFRCRQWTATCGGNVGRTGWRYQALTWRSTGACQAATPLI
jgi:hypothetical protein